MENKKNIAQMFEGPAHNLVWKNHYNEIIDEVYDKYDELFDSYYPAFSAPYPKRLTKEELVEEIKNGGKVIQEYELGVKITERELSLEERKEEYEKGFTPGMVVKNDVWLESKLKTRGVPTKKYRLEYNKEIVEYYE
jgi:hypothetical protein